MPRGLAVRAGVRLTPGGLWPPLQPGLCLAVGFPRSEN